MLSLAVRLGKDLGKVRKRFGQGKRELKGLIGKRRNKKERKMKRRNKNSPRLWRVKMEH